VKAFIEDNTASPASSTHSLTMPNVFSARDRAFISSLAGELHLTLTWDEYDDNNQNLVTWHLPGATEELPTVPGEQNGGDEVAEDDEAMAAVKRLLKKYDNAPVVDVDEEGDFDVRHDRRVKERMDEWKGTYYKVRVRFFVAAILLMS
jgi:5'-3' exoribonuclease 1